MNRRTILQLLSAALADRLTAAAAPKPSAHSPRLVLVTIGGIRRQESFSTQGVVNVPKLFGEMMPQSVFYPYTINEGVTSHFNSIASILTGVWQHVDDWGGEKPAHPTLFHYWQSGHARNPNDCWVVTSNKQLTANISPGVNVVLAKQLMIEAVERIIQGQSVRRQLERDQLLQEMKAVLETDYERIGWGAPSSSTFRDPAIRKTFVDALTGFIHGPGAPVSGDELTLLVGCEVLKRVRPSMLMMNFSDVEVAHSGSYSLHLGGIRRSDALCHRLWRFIQDDPALAPDTSLVIMNEFGRDPDGSSTNGFFNHRTNTECCRMAWSMVLGPIVRKPEVVERVVRQIDFAPTIGAWMGFAATSAKGTPLAELAG